MSYEVILRARRTRAASAELRAQARARRELLRTERNRLALFELELQEKRQHRRSAAGELGTWPYWAPPTRELYTVLVAVPEAA